MQVWELSAFLSYAGAMAAAVPYLLCEDCYQEESPCKNFGCTWILVLTVALKSAPVAQEAREKRAKAAQPSAEASADAAAASAPSAARPEEDSAKGVQGAIERLQVCMIILIYALYHPTAIFLIARRPFS